jgi:hypothetical protein
MRTLSHGLVGQQLGSPRKLLLLCICCQNLDVILLQLILAIELRTHKLDAVFLEPHTDELLHARDTERMQAELAAPHQD